MTDFPVINKEFLEFFLKCNLYNPSNPLKNIRILEDERWASRVYSFKGDSIVGNYYRREERFPATCYVIFVSQVTNLDGN